MKNPRAPLPPLPRPKRCPVCGAAIKWDTVMIGGRRVDEYRCINGHGFDREAVGRMNRERKVRKSIFGILLAWVLS